MAAMANRSRASRTAALEAAEMAGVVRAEVLKMAHKQDNDLAAEVEQQIVRDKAFEKKLTSWVNAKSESDSHWGFQQRHDPHGSEAEKSDHLDRKYREQCNYRAEVAEPIMIQLVNAIVRARPDDVLGFSLHFMRLQRDCQHRVRTRSLSGLTSEYLTQDELRSLRKAALSKRQRNTIERPDGPPSPRFPSGEASVVDGEFKPVSEEPSIASTFQTTSSMQEDLDAKQREDALLNHEALFGVLYQDGLVGGVAKARVDGVAHLRDRSETARVARARAMGVHSHVPAGRRKAVGGSYFDR